MDRKSLRQIIRLLSGFVLLTVLLLGTPRQASAASIIYVRRNAAGLNNGTSWANAYKSLQKALDVAVAGQQIWVAGGTYKPSVARISVDARTKTFNLKNGVKLYGGFAGTETLLSQRHWMNVASVLSGDIGVAGDLNDNAYEVVSASNLDNTALLDGFRITGGQANCGCFPGDVGGGIFLWNSDLVLRNLIIGSNTTSGYGGGIYNTDGNPTLNSVTFVSNSAGTFGAGGGMYNVNSSPILLNVTFYSNTASAGGGMYNSNSLPSLMNVTFMSNSAGSTGGGMHNDASSPMLYNVTFNGNSAASYGGAIYNSSSSPLLQNNTLSGNTATTWGGGMYNDNSSNPVVQNSIFWGDNTEVINTISASTFTDSIVAGGCPSKSACTNVIDLDPVLGSLQSNGGRTWTMSLGAASPAIDAGGRNAGCTARDQRGVQRPQGLACDIGAYEVRAARFISQAANDGQVIESTETSSVGGAANSASATFQVGDTATNQQVLGFLSFDTSALPDGATVVAAAIKIHKQAVAGVSPFVTHGNLLVDLKSPYFGSAISLAPSDFQAAGLPFSGVFDSPPVNGWYKGALGSTVLGSISKTGTTQLRLHFTWEDDNDSIADYVAFASGNTTTLANRPFMFVYYNP